MPDGLWAGLRAGLGLAFLLFGLVSGFRRRFRLGLIWIWLGFGFGLIWLSCTRILVGFYLIRLDFGWLRLDFGLIWLEFGSL